MSYGSAAKIIEGLREYLRSVHGGKARAIIGLRPGESLDGYEASEESNVRNYLSWITHDLLREIVKDRSRARDLIPQEARTVEALRRYSPTSDSFTALAMYMLWEHERCTAGNGED